MKHSRTLRRAISVLAIVGLLAGTAIAASTVTTKSLEAYYMGIQIVVDGVAITPKDVNGNVVDPFICDGTTYMPVRAVGEALGKEVTWDGETKTVYIGQVPGTETNWMTKLPPYQVNDGSKIYDGTDPKSSYVVGGVTRTSGVVLKDGDYYSNAFALWNTNCQYGSMTFTIAHSNSLGTSSSYNHNATLEIYLDGDYSVSYDLLWDAGPKTITVPLNYAANVKVSLGNSGSAYTEFSMFDISFSE